MRLARKKKKEWSNFWIRAVALREFLPPFFSFFSFSPGEGRGVLGVIHFDVFFSFSRVGQGLSEARRKKEE